MKQKNLTWLVGLVAVLLLLVACAEQPAADTAETLPADVEVQDAPEAEADPVPPPADAVGYPGEDAPIDEPAVPSQPIYSFGDVADRLWVLVAYGDALNPVVVPEGTLITATFSSVEGQVSGSGGCNSYFSGFESTDDGILTISGPVGATMMACPEGMEAEAAFLAGLETVTGWAISDEGRLELTYNTGQPFEERMVFVPGQISLTDNTWRLVSFGDPDELTPVMEGTEVTAVFTAETESTGTISGIATCNTYNGSYTIDGNAITFGPIASTMMMCLDGMEQETAYLAALSGAQSFEIAGSNLQIVTDQGVLNFTALDLPLENVLWQATQVDGQSVPEEVEITAVFEPGEEAGTGTLGGNNGCNNFNTSYSLDGTALTISGPMAMTMMACPGDELNALSSSFTAALEGAQSYAIEGETLTISGEAGEIVFAANRQPLEGTYWELISLGDANNQRPPAEGMAFTAQFSRLPGLPTGTVAGETGCNLWNATYSANLSEIKVNLPSTTRQACPQAEEEQAFFLTLNAATSYRILGNTLQIMAGEGETMLMLTFEAGQPPVEPVMDLTPLQDTFWYLSAFGDQTILPGSEITAGFAINEDGVTGTISGSGGCNAYNGPVAENFVIGPLAVTARACDQPLMDQESTYLNWLQSAFDFDRAGDQLLVSTASGVLTFNSSPILDQRPDLVETTWYLTSYETLNAIQGSNPTVLFSSDGRTLSGTTGCNTLNGTYNAEQGNTLAISDLSNTLTACATDELTQQEQTYLRLLPAAVSYRVSGNQLQIVTADGGTMNYTAIPPRDPVPPTAVITGPTVAEDGQQLTFDASRSSAGSLPIVRYTWEMGDGTTLSGRSVQYTFDDAGTYEVTLTVLDQSGQSGTATQTVQINPVVEVTGPTAVISGPNVVSTGEPVTFSAADSLPGTGAITGFQWQSGDGNDTGVSASNSFTTTYDQPGTFTVRLTVTDANGLSDSTTLNVQVTPAVQPEPPTAVISGPTTAMVGEQVTFSAADSQPGTSAITGFQWQSGDGNNTGVITDNTFSTIYAQPGTYYVVVTVADAGGLSDSATAQIVVSPSFAGSRWILNGTPDDISISLEVGNGTVSGFAGCNTYNATFSSTLMAGGSNNITMGPIVSSNAICTPDIMEVEQAYLANLQSASAYTVSGSTLTLTTVGGPLEFSAVTAVPLPASS